MLKHYVTYYPYTDKLKTFRQTWKGKDDLYEEYYENGKVSLIKRWDGDMWWKYVYDENAKKIYHENSRGYWRKSEYDINGNRIKFEDNFNDLFESVINSVNKI